MTDPKPGVYADWGSSWEDYDWGGVAAALDGKVSQEAPEPNLPPKERPAVGRFSVPIVRGDELAGAGTPELPSLPFLGEKNYLIQGLSHLIASYPKTGKTTLLVALMREWLDQGSKILYFTEEPRLIWETRLAGDAQRWAGVRFVFGFGASPDELLQIIHEAEEEIVVIDTLRAMIQFQDEKDNSEIARRVTPWIDACRQTGKTFIGASHETKGGGEHGRGIAGGHALFGVVDVALEISRVSALDTRRHVRAYGRLLTPPDLAYERDEEGNLVALGSPHIVEVEEVARRSDDIIGEEWMSRKEILAAFEEPKPGSETLRLALALRVERGELERDPTEDKKGVTYRWRNLPTAALSLGGNSGLEPEATTERESSNAQGEVEVSTEEAAALVQREFEAEVVR